MNREDFCENEGCPGLAAFGNPQRFWSVCEHLQRGLLRHSDELPEAAQQLCKTFEPYVKAFVEDPYKEQTCLYSNIQDELFAQCGCPMDASPSSVDGPSDAPSDAPSPEEESVQSVHVCATRDGAAASCMKLPADVKSQLKDSTKAFSTADACAEAGCRLDGAFRVVRASLAPLDCYSPDENTFICVQNANRSKAAPREPAAPPAGPRVAPPVAPSAADTSAGAVGLAMAARGLPQTRAGEPRAFSDRSTAGWSVGNDLLWRFPEALSNANRDAESHKALAAMSAGSQPGGGLVYTCAPSGNGCEVKSLDSTEAPGQFGVAINSVASISFAQAKCESICNGSRQELAALAPTALCYQLGDCSQMTRNEARGTPCYQSLAVCQNSTAQHRALLNVGSL